MAKISIVHILLTNYKSRLSEIVPPTIIEKKKNFSIYENSTKTIKTCLVKLFWKCKILCKIVQIWWRKIVEDIRREKHNVCGWFPQPKPVGVSDMHAHRRRAGNQLHSHLIRRNYHFHIYGMLVCFFSLFFQIILFLNKLKMKKKIMFQISLHTPLMEVSTNNN